MLHHQRLVLPRSIYFWYTWYLVSSLYSISTTRVTSSFWCITIVYTMVRGRRHVMSWPYSYSNLFWRPGITTLFVYEGRSDIETRHICVYICIESYQIKPASPSSSSLTCTHHLASQILTRFPRGSLRSRRWVSIGSLCGILGDAPDTCIILKTSSPFFHILLFYLFIP